MKDYCQTVVSAGAKITQVTWQLTSAFCKLPQPRTKTQPRTQAPPPAEKHGEEPVGVVYSYPASYRACWSCILVPRLLPLQKSMGRSLGTSLPRLTMQAVHHETVIVQVRSCMNDAHTWQRFSRLLNCEA